VGPLPRALGGHSLALLLVLLALPVTVRGWGFEAHRLVNEEATRTLPEPLRELFEGNVAYLRQHSVDPDVWRTWQEDEAPNHFFNLDSFPDPGALPRSEREHLKAHGEAAARHGRVPWRVGEVYDELVAAFRKRKVDAVLERAAVLGHYVADAHVPLHATVNYDGELSDQDGIHRRWETDLFARYQRQIETAVRPSPAQAVGDPVTFTLGVLQGSLAHAERALASDRAAAGDRDYLETAGDDRYDDGYYSRLFELEGESMARRLGEAAEAVGSLWLSAWQKAGRPTLDWLHRVPRVRGESRLVVAVLDGAGAELVEAAADRGALPHLDALRREGSVGRLQPPFPARAASTQATLWTGAWPRHHGVTGDGVPHPSGTILETSPGDRSLALGAEPLWVTAAREGVTTVVTGVPQASPFSPFLDGRGFGGDFGRSLILLGQGEGNIEPKVATARDLAPRPATSWEGEVPPSSLEVEVPVGGGTLPGLFYDDPEDPVEGLDTLALSATRRVDGAAVLKPSPAGREEDGFAGVPFHTATGPAVVHFRLFTLSGDGRDILLWHSAGARTVGSREPVAAAAMELGGLLPGGAPGLYRDGSFGPPLWEGGDGTAERRYLETVRLAVRQHTRLASLVLDRTRWGLALVALPFPAEPVRLWAGRLDPDLPGHDAALAVRLRPFLDEALRLTDAWVGELARRTPPDAALAVVGDRGLGGVNRVARPNVALRAAGLLATAEDGGIDLTQTKAAYAPAGGGFLVLNLDTRPGGIQPRKGADIVRAASIGATREMTDPLTGEPVIAELLIPGTRGAPPEIGGPSGGFLYLRPAPGVVLSAETTGPVVETIEPRGDAFDPALPSAAGLLVLTGQGVAGGRRLGDVAPIDVAPTLAALLGLRPPAQAAGEPITRALRQQTAAGASEPR
jgi:hypothetical protein